MDLFGSATVNILESVFSSKRESENDSASGEDQESIFACGESGTMPCL
jgi:hypothetical protein